MSAKVSFKSLISSKSLAVIGFCSVLGACGEEHKSTHPELKLAKRVEMPAPAQPESLKKLSEAPMTATAPLTPRSVLDSVKPSTDASPSVQAEPQATLDKALAQHDQQDLEVKAEERPVVPEQVKIERFVLATSVEEREPVGESESFDTDTPKIFAFMQFANDQAPFAVKVHWEKVGDAASPYGVQLEVPTSPRYRTWSWTKIRREPGTYRAVVRTLDGQEILSKEFTISPSLASSAPMAQ
ncbi:MAG: DUF2914 domain-containing protein [Myxococcales bacterium]